MTLKCTYILILLNLFCSSLLISQNTIKISGFISDSLNIPLDKATLIAVPSVINGKIKYSVTNIDGYYKLNLNDSTTYKITISHIGYQKLEFFFNTSDKIEKKNYSYVLNPSQELLKEVVIKYKYKAIEQKNDTLTYKINAFVNGNENKMEDVLNKLPGISIDDNVIKVRGENVNNLLVEGKSFFGGSNKLALKNIPADIIDKIEIIYEFTEDELLKDISNKDATLALNVILKEDKKNFVFGNIEAGIGLQDFYSLHPTIFKYKPKSNFSFIGDINNYNESSITFSDLLRLSGGVGNLFNKNDNYKELYNFASSNNDRFKSDTKFSALNFYHEFNQNLKIEGYAILSDEDITTKTENQIQYIGSNPILEQRNSNKITNNTSAVVNLKLSYKPNAIKRWSYNANFISNLSNYQSSVESNANLSRLFLNTDDSQNNNFKHNLEGIYRLGKKHTLGIGFNQTLSNTNFLKDWSSNSIFLEDFYPLIESERYKLLQFQYLSNNVFDFIIKDYYLLSSNNHLFGSISYSNLLSRIDISESQILDDDTALNFSNQDNLFGNNLEFSLRDFKIAFGWKTRLGQATLTAEAIIHNYNLVHTQTSRISDNNLFFEPKLDLEYVINKDSNIGMSYNFSNNYFSPNIYLQNQYIVSFNNVFTGNTTVIDEKAHNFGLDYNNYLTTKDIFLDLGLDYTVKNPVLNNTVVQNGINQDIRPVVLDLPEESLTFFAEISKELRNGSIDFSFLADWSRFNQIINSDIDLIATNDIRTSLKFTRKISKKTFLKIGYSFSNNYVNDAEDSNFSNHSWSLNFDTKLFNRFILNTSTDYSLINDFSNDTNSFLIPNFNLTYIKDNSNWSYSITGDNIFNNGLVFSNSFSGNVITNRRVFTLPSIFMIKVNYSF